MKTNILTLSVLFTLSTAFGAEPSAPAAADKTMAERAAEEKAAKCKTATKEEATKLGCALPETAEQKAKREADEAEARKKAEAAKDADKKKDALKVVTDSGNTFVDKGSGEVEAFVGCNTSEGCKKFVLKVDSLADIAKLNEALKVKVEEAKKVEVKKEEEEKFDVAAYEKTLKADLESSVLDACDLDVVEGRSRSGSRRSRDDDEDATDRRLIQYQSALGLDLPKADDRADCAATEFQSKLDELSESLEKELAGLGLEETDVKKLSSLRSELKRKIANEKDAKKKATLESALAKVEVIDKKIAATQAVSKEFYKRNMKKRVETDLAARAGYGTNYLHEMASGTPDIFKSVRGEASRSIFEVYRKQAQAYATIQQRIKTTTNPEEKQYLLNESIKYGNLATRYNAHMYGPCATMANSSQLADQRCLSPAETSMVSFARESGNSVTDVLNSVRSSYRDGAFQVMTALNKVNAGQTSALTGILSTDGTVTTTNNIGQSVSYTGRGRRVMNGTQVNGAATTGTVGRAALSTNGTVMNGNAVIPQNTGGRVILRQ